MFIDYATSLSLHFNSHFPDEPGIASFIGAKDDGGGGDNWSYKTCKAAVKSSAPTNRHPTFLQAGCPSRRPTDSVRALKGNECATSTHFNVNHLMIDIYRPSSSLHGIP